MGRKRFGFTLAEVLLVLSVIGVVAALTIPTLIQKLSTDQYKVAYKKAFSVASQSYATAVTNNGGTGFGPYNVSSTVEALKWDEFIKNLNIIKQCNGNTLGNCWSAQGVGPDTSASNGCANYKLANQNANKAIVTSDGMFWLAYGNPVTAATIAIDVNGAKGPNQWGQDVFNIKLDDVSVSPYGCELTGNSFSYLYN